MPRITLLLALFASLAVVAWAGRFEFDERALLAELEGRPLSPHASLMSLHDLSPDSLALLQADGHDIASPQSLLQVKAEATAADEAPTVLMEMGAQAESEQSLNAQARKEFDEGLRQYNEAQMEDQDHSFVETDAEADAETEVYADAEAYMEANAHLFTEADAGADADADAETETEAAAHAESESSAEAGAETQFLSATTLESEHFDAQAALAHVEPPMPGMSVDGAAELDADFPEASAALVEMQSQASAAAAVMATAQARVEGLLENRGRLGNYPGWSPMALLEMMAEADAEAEPAAKPAADPAPAAAAAAQPAPVPAAAGAQPVPAAAAAAPSSSDPTAGQFSPVVKQLPPESDNVKHITLNQGSGGASLPNSGELGVSKINVHVYGAPDVEQDKQAALQSMVRRLADNQSESYKKINTLLKKLQMCQIKGKAAECLPKITEKIEDFKAEWLADAKRV